MRTNAPLIKSACAKERTIYYLDLGEYDLHLLHRPVGPVSIIETPESLHVGYLVGDEDSPSPMDSCDGLGRILYVGKDDLEVAHALGLGQGDFPDFSQFEEEASIALAELYGGSYSNEERLAALMEKEWYLNLMSGLCGNRYAVPLTEVGRIRYDYNRLLSKGQSFYNMAWENKEPSDLRAVWIPDPCLVDEADRRAEVYAFGRILNILSNGKERYVVEFDSQHFESGAMFNDWVHAFEVLRLREEAMHFMPDPVQKRRGEIRAAVELANEGLAEQHRWESGEVFGIVWEEFSASGDSWVLVAHDGEFGLFGEKWAREELARMAQRIVESQNE